MNILNHFEKFQSIHSGPGRDQALGFLRDHGLPTRKDEDWKYTSLKFLSETDYVPVALSQVLPTHADFVAIRQSFAEFCTNVVFINGVLDLTLSEALPSEAILADCQHDKSTFVDSLEALSSLYSPASYEIKVSKESVIVKPIHLIFWSQGEKSLISSQFKISVGARAQVQFIVSYVGASLDQVTNVALDVDIAASAKVSLVKIQEESLQSHHIGLSRFHLANHAELESLSFSTGAKLSRHTLEVLLKGEGATAQVNGVYAVTGTQHVDNNTAIDHVVGHCNTQQLYKGLLDGESRAVFNGKVLIRRHAQKANSEQLNNNLILSRKAEVDSKPMLQIDADDVKAAHGSTVGQLNKEELFYLLSRAIPKDKAVPMLSYGFLSEVIYRLQNKQTQEWLKTKLDKAFARISTEHL